MKKSNHGRVTSSPITYAEPSGSAGAAIAPAVEAPAAPAQRPSALGPCLLSAACCAIILWLLLGLNSKALHTPLSYGGDALVHLSIAKNISSGHLWWNNPSLGMPFGADWRDFPMNLTVDYNVIRVLALIFHDPFLVLNLCWLLIVMATGTFAAYSLIRMNIRPALSVCIGLVYAFQPFTWYRNTGHFNLMFYLVPLLAGFILVKTVSAIDSRAESEKRWWRQVPVYIWIAAVAQGFSYAYNSFFTCFFLALGAALAVAVRRNFRVALPFLAVAAVICVSFAANLAPSFIYWARNGPNTQLVQKSAMESDVYGLKIRYLLLPILDHRLPLFRHIAAAFQGAFPRESETQSARLGLVGAIGFLYLLWVGLYGLFGKRSERDTVFRVLAFFVLCTLLVAVVGGFGSIFNTFVSPDIRAYNRLVVYIDYFSLAAVALLLARWMASHRINRVLLYTGLAALTALAVLDESSAEGLKNYQARAVPFQADQAFAQKIQAAFPPGAEIFQLPHTGFPIDSQPNGTMVYRNSIPYLHTSHLKWSWGAVEGRHFEWGAGITSLPPDAMVASLKKTGFSGLWFDADAYPDSSKLLGSLTKLVGSPILVNAYRHEYLFDLRTTKPEIPGPVSTDADMVRGLYHAFLGRDPDAATLQSAVNRLKFHTETRTQLVNELFSQPEFNNSGLFVAASYLALFDREPDYGGWRYWTTALNKRQLMKEDLIAAFERVPEYIGHNGNKTGQDVLKQVYKEMGVRPAAGELEADSGCLRSGKCALPDLLETTLSKPGILASARNKLHLKLLYFVLLGRDPGSVDDSRGSGTANPDGDIIDSILSSSEYNSRH